MNQDSVSALISDDDAKNQLEFRQSITPPPLPTECDLPADRIAHLCAPPIFQPSNGDERPLHQMHFAAAGSPFQLQTRASRSRTSWQTACWLGSIALHVVAILLLALILAPADFGGTGIHSISVTLNQQVQQNELTRFELAFSDQLLTPNDSPSSIPIPLLSELSLHGTGAITDSASAVLSQSAAARGSFFGIEAGGHEFVYILDMSGSMEGRPFDRASAELMRSVALLGPNQGFYVLLFSSEMLWTTVVGLGFGFIQFGRRSWQWTPAVFQWEYLGAMPIIGVVNGLVAALWLWALATDGLAWQSAKVVTAGLMAGGLAILQCYAAEWITGAFVMHLKESLIVVAAQSVFVSASLAVAKAPLSKAS